MTDEHDVRVDPGDRSQFSLGSSGWLTITYRGEATYLPAKEVRRLVNFLGCIDLDGIENYREAA
jgi:hypothetical protein